jgi:hypothetical protein
MRDVKASTRTQSFIERNLDCITWGYNLIYAQPKCGGQGAGWRTPSPYEASW